MSASHVSRIFHDAGKQIEAVPSVRIMEERLVPTVISLDHNHGIVSYIIIHLVETQLMDMMALSSLMNFNVDMLGVRADAWLIGNSHGTHVVLKNLAMNLGVGRFRSSRPCSFASLMRRIRTMHSLVAVERATISASVELRQISVWSLLPQIKENLSVPALIMCLGDQ